MLKLTKLLTLVVPVIFLITGCQTKEKAELEIEMKSEEEQQKILETYILEDYKKVFDEAVSEANKLESDEQLNKWIIRTLANEKLLYETELTDEEVLDLAEREMEEYEVWISIAKEEYGITVTDEEIDEFIKEGPDTSDLPQHQAYADALGLTLEELNHDFDRDLYKKNVIWLKLKPQLEKKYGTNDNNKQIEKYEEEVKKKIN
ncbi:hypothetical protein FZC79_09255 [Rossellomorea vietnamensis]|uniref:Uncharacterized protein n=1 Tax=Rossellomorea vietnamensis TaxID=218284 RepID=A0A5D4KES6_9BACI|nr:hypothetical protein [Rossellomorea vietnamensis]TYR75797.1 hypothetical protein FZC79_09255 [Rossellomorea vietnamensis]